MNIEIINKSNNELPKYETIQSAGMDLRAHLAEPIILKPLERNIIKTGLFLSLATYWGVILVGTLITFN